jgi:hypothetical protein
MSGIFARKRNCQPVAKNKKSTRVKFFFSSPGILGVMAENINGGIPKNVSKKGKSTKYKV